MASRVASTWAIVESTEYEGYNQPLVVLRSTASLEEIQAWLDDRFNGRGPTKLEAIQCASFTGFPRQAVAAKLLESGWRMKRGRKP